MLHNQKCTGMDAGARRYAPWTAHKSRFRQASILLDDVHLKKIKVNILNKVILRKAGLSMPLKITYVAVKPDGLSQVKSKAGILKCLKNLVCTCVVTVIFYCNITHQVRVSINLKPNTHIILPKVFSDDCIHT